MGRLALLVLLAVSARAQTLVNDVEKTDSPTFKSSLQETLESLATKSKQNNAAIANLTLNGVVVSVGASNPLCSSGGVNPSITFCGNINESQVTNLVTDLAAKASLTAFNNYISTNGPLVVTLGASTNTLNGLVTGIGAGFTVSTNAVVTGTMTVLGSNGGTGLNVVGNVVASNFSGSGALLTAIPESAVTNLTSDLSAKYPYTGGTLLGGGYVTGSWGVRDTLYANAVNVSTGMNVGPGNTQPTGVSSAFAGNVTVGNGTWPGNIYALNGVAETNDLLLFDTSSESTTIQSVGGGRFGCNSGISTGCGVQTIGTDGRIPALNSTYFANTSGAALTGIPSTGSISGFYLPYVGNTSANPMTGPVTWIEGVGPYLQFQNTDATQGSYLFELQMLNASVSRHRMISYGGLATGVLGLNGMLELGADSTADSLNRGLLFNGGPNRYDLFVSTWGLVAVGSTGTISGYGFSGTVPSLFVGGNIYSTGTLSAFGTGAATYDLSLSTSMTFAQGTTGIGIKWADGTISTTASAGGGGSSSGGSSASTVTVTWLHDDFWSSANGSNKSFTLSAAPSSTQAVTCVLDGTMLSNTSDYILTGQTVAMTTAPVAACTSSINSNCTASFWCQYTIYTSTLPAVFILNSSQTVSGATVFTSSVTVGYSSTVLTSTANYSSVLINGESEVAFSSVSAASKAYFYNIVSTGSYRAHFCFTQNTSIGNFAIQFNNDGSAIYQEGGQCQNTGAAAGLNRSNDTQGYIVDVSNGLGAGKSICGDVRFGTYEGLFKSAWAMADTVNNTNNVSKCTVAVGYAGSASISVFNFFTTAGTITGWMSLYYSPISQSYQ
jgi:hypothetical protein